MDPLFLFLKEPLVLQTAADCNDNNRDDSEHGLGLVEFDEEFSASGSKANFEECDADLEFLSNPYMAKALDVIQFKIFLDEDMFKEIVRVFKPKMAHQIFGNEELIYGYRNLQITFNILPNSFQTHIKVNFTSKKDYPLRGEIADDITGKLADWFPHNIEDEAAFNELKAHEDMSVIFGESILSFTIKESQKSHNISINICNSQQKGFVEFHKRFQALIVFYIDAASMIDLTDKNWTFFYVYQDLDLGDGKIGYIPIGFCTVYTFTMSQRARIAQQFILPNFQRKGIGRRLLGCVYNYFSTLGNIQYITVESPCEGFTIMRDKLDLHFIAKHSTFGEKNILQGYSQKMEADAKDICKMCSTQVRHLYFILLCHYTKHDERKYSGFIKELKRDIHTKYKKKLKRMNTNHQEMEKIIKIKRIVEDDCMDNRRIHRDTKVYLSIIKPQLVYLNKLLPRTER